jgi:mannose-6-phosphate isomerase-like protein (cupin superfamily)
LNQVTNDRASAFVLLPGQGRAIDLGNFVMTVKADKQQTDGAFVLLEAAEPAHFGPPRHIHHDAAEAFYVLEGSYNVFVGDRTYECPAGSFIFIPAGVDHGFRVGPLASRKLNLYSPAAMVGYFDDLSAALRSGDTDDAGLSRIALAHGMEVTGRVPEGYL